MGYVVRINIGTCWERCEKSMWGIDGRSGLDGGVMEACLGIYAPKMDLGEGGQESLAGGLAIMDAMML